MPSILRNSPQFRAGKLLAEHLLGDALNDDSERWVNGSRSYNLDNHDADVAALGEALAEVERLLVRISDRRVTEYRFDFEGREFGGEVADDLDTIRALRTARWITDDIAGGA
ncbi:MAG TPA: hypothetical protein VK090_06635 [Paracoccaceae bacterium]|nr:hypothetical protein [Paracoccaceae bacterium]